MEHGLYHIHTPRHEGNDETMADATETATNQNLPYMYMIMSITYNTYTVRHTQKHDPYSFARTSKAIHTAPFVRGRSSTRSCRCGPSFSRAPRASVANRSGCCFGAVLSVCCFHPLPGGKGGWEPRGGCGGVERRRTVYIPVCTLKKIKVLRCAHAH